MKQLEKLDINNIKSFDFREYLLKIITHWKLFLLVLALGFIIAFFVNIRAQKIYSLKGTIAVKEEQNPLFTSSTNIAFNWGGPSDKVETIITILKSRTHNEKVVRRLKYYIEYLQEGRFRLEDVYGKAPFVLELDSLGHQLLNIPIKLDFLDNDEVLLSVEFEEDANSCINYCYRNAILCNRNAILQIQNSQGEYI